MAQPREQDARVTSATVRMCIAILRYSLDAPTDLVFAPQLHLPFMHGELRRGRIIRATVALSPGTRLGAYEISSLLGEGGMGQVYRATDTRLKRQVAIKILPPALAAAADRLSRFQREAEVLAALNHPHIAAIYGLEESGGVSALVMELA